MSTKSARKRATERWRRNHPDRVLADYQRKQKRLRDFFLWIKNRPCMDCHQSFPSVCMDFDHRPGEKKRFNVNTSASRAISEIQKEIMKCDLVCANCHRIRTHITRRCVLQSQA